MKVYKIKADDYTYGFSGKDEAEAKKTFFEYVGECEIDSIEEIPESEWDEKFITIHEDNDTSLPAEKYSIREELVEGMSMLIYTNDPEFID